jgi:UDP-N-acetylmuramoyl-tripeptide--D-alanyl-D-alanine ligase
MNRLKYHLYLFQLEDYNARRYVTLLGKTSFIPPEQWRQNLVMTAKAKILMVLAIILASAVAFCLSLLSTGIISFVLFLGIFCANIIFLYPFFLVIASLLLYPLEIFMKRRIIAKAKKKMARFPGLRVIGIAGSYGKTTMKDTVAAILEERFKVLKTPENINTAIGIARLIEEHLNEDIDIFVVEMGEYRPDDVKEICNIVHPEIGIVTGINEAHLERMEHISNTVATIFEIAHGEIKKIFLNADDALIMQNYKKFINGKVFSFYGSAPRQEISYAIANSIFQEDASGYVFTMHHGNENLGEFHISLLGEYAQGTAMAGVLIGQEFGMDIVSLKRGVANIKPPKHRLERLPTHNGIIVIDDSYNSNPAGAFAAVKVLNNFKNKRKIYVTPGLVEMGSASARVHNELGRTLATHVDLVILIKNSVTNYIKEGLQSEGFPADNIIIFETAAAMHAGIGAITKPGDVILFQNDWPDNYL